MPKYTEDKIFGHYLYFTSYCVVEAMHVHAGDEEMTQAKSAKFFVKADGSSVMKRKGDLTVREAKGIQAYIKKHYLAMYAKWCRKSKNGFYRGEERVKPRRRGGCRCLLSAVPEMGQLGQRT